MAAAKKKIEPVKDEAEEVEMTKVMRFYKKDGWYKFDLFEIPLKSLEGAKLIKSSEPEIMPIMLNNIKNAVCDIYEI